MVHKLKQEGEPIHYLLNAKETALFLSTCFKQIADFADDTPRECEITAYPEKEVLTDRMITDTGLRIHRVYLG